MSVLPPSSATATMSRAEIATASRGKLLEVWTSVLLANNLLERRGEKLFAFTEPAEVSEGEEGEWEEWREVGERERSDMKGDLMGEEAPMNESVGDASNRVTHALSDRVMHRLNDLSIDRGEATRTCQSSRQP